MKICPAVFTLFHADIRTGKEAVRGSFITFPSECNKKIFYFFLTMV